MFWGGAGEETPRHLGGGIGGRGRGAGEQRGGGVHDLAAAADGFADDFALGAGVDEADAVAVDGAEQHDEAREFEEGLAFGLRAGTEGEGRGVFEDDEQGDLAFFDEFFSVGLAEAGGDVPVDVADVVAELVFDDLVELHAAAAKGRAVFAAEDVFHGVADAPFELAQEGQRRRGGRGGGGSGSW